MISWFRLMSASRHAQLSPYPEFCSSWLLSSLPASLAGILQECTAGREAPQAGRQAGRSRSAQKIFGGNDEANPCMMPTNMFLEGPYPGTTDINIMNGTTGYPTPAGGCVSEHPEPSLGRQGPTEEQLFGMSWIWSMAAQGEQSQPSVTPEQLQWHEQARF